VDWVAAFGIITRTCHRTRPASNIGLRRSQIKDEANLHDWILFIFPWWAAAGTSSSSASAAVTHYKAESEMAKQLCPLDWWKVHAGAHQLTRDIHYNSTVPCEHVLLKYGFVVTVCCSLTSQCQHTWLAASVMINEPNNNDNT